MLLRAATWKWKVEGMYCLLANGLVDGYIRSFGVANSVTRYGSKYSSVTSPAFAAAGMSWRGAPQRLRRGPDRGVPRIARPRPRPHPMAWLCRSPHTPLSYSALRSTRFAAARTVEGGLGRLKPSCLPLPDGPTPWLAALHRPPCATSLVFRVTCPLSRLYLAAQGT